MNNTSSETTQYYSTTASIFVNGPQTLLFDEVVSQIHRRLKPAGMLFLGVDKGNLRHVLAHIQKQRGLTVAVSVAAEGQSGVLVQVTKLPTPASAPPRPARQIGAAEWSAVRQETDRQRVWPVLWPLRPGQSQGR